MKETILFLVNSFISCSKKQYFKTQLINTEHRTQNTDTEHRTQTHVKNVLKILHLETVKQCIVSGIPLRKLIDNEKANHFCCLETLFVVYSTMPRQTNK